MEDVSFNLVNSACASAMANGLKEESSVMERLLSGEEERSSGSDPSELGLPSRTFFGSSRIFPLRNFEKFYKSDFVLTSKGLFGS